MPYSARAIANYFIDLAEASGKTLTPMKVQKLVYYAHGWHLAITGRPLINEQIEAWKFGPVIRSLYGDLAQYGDSPIRSKIKAFDVVRKSGGGLAVTEHTPEVEEGGKEGSFTRDLLRKVWDVFGAYTASRLSTLTHAPGTPWDQVFRQYNGDLPKGTDIPPETIRAHFVEQAKA